ncbi:hypothetical protein ACH5RR_040425 [Cinchona calisaya]|uniref:Uncharacterized protein n=1 Tax=Cinchona calisaya TaxID=153742 RepID=A0ABD2XSQ1_9GENT
MSASKFRPQVGETEVPSPTGLESNKILLPLYQFTAHGKSFYRAKKKWRGSYKCQGWKKGKSQRKQLPLELIEAVPFTSDETFKEHLKGKLHTLEDQANKLLSSSHCMDDKLNFT